MGSFYRKQEEMRLELPGGEWLLVKKHLTFGEQRDAQARLVKGGTFRAGGQADLDLKQLGIAQAVVYLLDWSITDVNDNPIRIRDASYDVVAAALQNMTPEGCGLILDAISAHAGAMSAEREHEKKDRGGKPAPDPTSTSVA